MPALLRERGLVNIFAVAETPIVEGGTPILEWLRMTLDQMMNHDLAFEVPGEGGYEEWRCQTSDPNQWLVGAPIVAARGQLPG